jgi:hypothetical protein
MHFSEESVHHVHNPAAAAKRFLSCVLVLCAFLLTGTQVVAEVSTQLRDQVMQQAASMALSATWVHEELRSTGFLDDPKTREIVERSPAAYALAWAALQAEEKQPGTAVELRNRNKRSSPYDQSVSSAGCLRT